MTTILPPGTFGRAVSLDRYPGAGTLRTTPLGDVVLGMPHLSPYGLSETWLLKELGHRHWYLLAEAVGMAAPDFRDEHGDPIYAAFCAVSLIEGRLDRVRENDTLVFTSDIARISHTQVMSRHSLSVEGRNIGTVEMVSAFVKRGKAGTNHSVVRASSDCLPPVDAGAVSDLAASASAFRGGRVREHMGFDLSGASVQASHDFHPCPSQDFNGAGFLYFSNFVAFVDRAEWLHARDLGLSSSTVRRDVFFYGNIDPGDSLRIHVLDAVRGSGGFRHRCRIERASDGARLADVFTEKAFLA